MQGDLETSLSPPCSVGDIQDALLWLVDVGLVSRREQGNRSIYVMELPLLASWVRMSMTSEEIMQWRIQ